MPDIVPFLEGGRWRQRNSTSSTVRSAVRILMETRPPSPSLACVIHLEPLGDPCSVLDSRLWAAQGGPIVN